MHKKNKIKDMKLRNQVNDLVKSYSLIRYKNLVIKISWIDKVRAANKYF